ncbi:retrovirus-related pol polyprotein from transposon RE1 [Citrus sinensis]|uniref:Retrovirus-related pol polyprotein from transposon RE1 n=1 Tax=Citrus sinensis TaxID=2711 RepID=A0ACB8IGU8_CITSI|nr:retrovirus-related pol polyprotein from transposon RE1 [Citrus sinensis]
MDIIPPPAPQVVVHQDNSAFPTGITLDETNYSLWSQLMEMRISARNKAGYLTGETKKPAPGDPNLGSWITENQRVKSWLIDSMSPSLMQRFIRLPTAKDIWEAVSKTFYDGTDETCIFELNQRSFSTKQDGRPLPTYYNELVAIFQEIDHRTTTQEGTVEGVLQLHSAMARLRVHIFLSGLDSEFEQVRGEILRKDPKLDLESTYAYVRRDYQQRQTMGGSHLISENLAMLASQNRNGYSKNRGNQSSSKVNNLVCTHCGEKGHSQQRCYEIIGYPDWWDFSKKPRKKISGKANVTAAKDEEQPSPSANVAHPGIIGKTSVCSVTSKNRMWIIDTGASEHMTRDSSQLKSVLPSFQSVISTANGSTSPIIGEGSITLSNTLTLDTVLVVPSLEYNLLSVSQITSTLACTVTFWPTFCVFQDILTRKILGYGVRRGKLYYLELTENEGPNISQANQASNKDRTQANVWLWHRRLGHISFGYLKKLQPHLFSTLNDLNFHCDICEMAKSHRTSYLPSLNKSLEPFVVIHSDVWGPAKVASLSKARFFVTFIDECTRMIWVSLLIKKSDVCLAFQEFHKMVSTQYQKQIRVLQSDNGTEYMDASLGKFLNIHGIRHQTSCTYTPQQNGLAERKNRQILEVVRASLFGMNMPRFYWGEAVKSAAYIINRTPSRVLDFQTPQQKMQSLLSIPHLPNLEPRIFGCIVYAHIPKSLRTKLDPCAKRCVFIGYSDLQKGYRCYDPHTKKLQVTLDVSFHELEPYYSGGISYHSLQGESLCEENGQRENEGGDEFVELEHMVEKLQNGDGNEVQQGCDNMTETECDPSYFLDMSEAQSRPLELPMSTPLTEELTESVPPQVISNPLSNESNEPFFSVEDMNPRYPQRLNRGIPKKQYEPDPKSKIKYPISNYMSSHRLCESYALTINQLSTISIPSSVQDALEDPKWTKAMNEEMEALQKNATWELVSLPKGRKTIGCRWVFTVKLRADGSIDRYKARLVAKGYTQRYGIDYQDTFAPVAKINTIRIIISIAANRDWPLKQFDVKNAFLNGDLEEEVYMELPPGVKHSSMRRNEVCKLKKSLYGLKQSPRAWFGRFSATMKAAGYKQSNSDHTLFIKHKGGKVTVLIVYVDDMVLTGDDLSEMKALQEHLAAEFEMKDLGQLKYFLGIEVARSKSGIFLSQRKYVLDLLTETGMLDCKPAETPMEMNHKLGILPNQTPTDKGRYQRLVGRLIYLSHTRPDITYAVSIVSQFMHSPSEEHMDAVYRILRYLKCAPGKGLLFSKNNVSNIEGYTDSDWAGDQTTRRSTSGYFTFVEGNLVTWRSKKQKVVARSSAEAEFRGMAQGVCEMLWIKNILKDLGIDYAKPMNLKCDNKAAIEIAQNPVQHDRTKHVEVNRHFIKEKLDEKTIQFPFVQSGDQLADILTKAVSGRVFHDIIDKLGMIDIYAPT